MTRMEDKKKDSTHVMVKSMAKDNGKIMMRRICWSVGEQKRDEAKKEG